MPGLHINKFSPLDGANNLIPTTPLFSSIFRSEFRTPSPPDAISGAGESSAEELNIRRQTKNAKRTHFQAATPTKQTDFRF